MSSLLFNKLAAGALSIALVGVGGFEVWRRVTGQAEHHEPVRVMLSQPAEAAHETPAAAPVPVQIAEGTPAGEGAPLSGEGTPPAVAAQGATPAGAEPAASVAPAAAPAEPTPPPVPAGPDYKALISAASLEEGKGLAVKCTMCHDMTSADKTLLGPPLFDLIGRDVASWTGFNYSAGPGSLSAVDGGWDYAKLDDFLENPKKLAPNTMMLFPGMKREGERMALIAYIRSLTEGEPKPLP